MLLEHHRMHLFQWLQWHERCSIHKYLQDLFRLVIFLFMIINTWKYIGSSKKTKLLISKQNTQSIARNWWHPPTSGGYGCAEFFFFFFYSNQLKQFCKYKNVLLFWIKIKIFNASISSAHVGFTTLPSILQCGWYWLLNAPVSFRTDQTWNTSQRPLLENPNGSYFPSCYTEQRDSVSDLNGTLPHCKCGRRQQCNLWSPLRLGAFFSNSIWNVMWLPQS